MAKLIMELTNNECIKKLTFNGTKYISYSETDNNNVWKTYTSLRDSVKENVSDSNEDMLDIISELDIFYGDELDLIETLQDLEEWED